MLECLLDSDDHNRRGLFAIDGEPPLEVCILGDLRSSVHPIGLIYSGHKENQCNTRIFNKVLEAIDPIVTATVRYEQRPTVFCNLHEAGLIALGRAVETLSASCCKNQKWRGGNKCAPNLVDMVKRFLGNALDWLGVKCPQTIDACHNALEISHCNLLPVYAGARFLRPVTRQGYTIRLADVRFWPKADMSRCTAHVRYWG